MRFLRAEILRSWLSLRFFLPLIAVLCAAQAASINAGIRALGGQAGLAALHLYAVGVVVPLGLLTSVMTEYAEERQRYGGLLWRPCEKWKVQGARLAVTMGYALIGHICASLIVVGMNWQFALLETTVFAGAYGVGLLLWSLAGRVSVGLGILLGLAWDVLSIFRAETPSWYLNPMCWALRASLPVFGVHANSVPADDGSVAGIDPVLPALLHLVMGGACWAVAVAMYRLRSAQPQAERAQREVPLLGGHGRTSAARAMMLPLPWRVWVGLSVVMILGLGAMRMRYGTTAATGAYALICVPAGAFMAGTMAWRAHRDAWRGLVSRAGRDRMFGALLTVVYLPLVVVCGVGGVIATMGDGGPYSLMVMPGVLAMILVMVCWGSAISLSATIIGWILLLIWSLMAGASILADNGLWWLSAPWSWVWVVHEHPEHWVVIVVLTWAVAGGLRVLARRDMRHRIT